MSEGGELPEEDLKVLSEAAQGLVLSAVEDKPAESATILSLVDSRYGHHGVWLVCNALASCVAIMTRIGEPVGGQVVGFGLRGPDGKPANPDDVPDEMKPAMWAMRFVAAWANDGPDGTYDLFYAFLDDRERAVLNVAAQGVARLL